ncbi:MAG TPA: peptidylprolyl isomerase [Ramlibacter sp.]|nr:peptidylprolyl isomerase [Ramlibacter sp.]
MKIEKDTVPTVRFKIADDKGRLISDSRDPMVYLHGGYDNTLPKIEQALQGKQSGDQVVLTLAPADAFGERDESLTRTIAKSEFPPGIKVGGQMDGYTDAGRPHTFWVTKVKGDKVLLDGNHPLAGQAVRFHLQVMSVRPATAEEIAHKHVHGEHGHHH